MATRPGGAAEVISARQLFRAEMAHAELVRRIPQRKRHYTRINSGWSGGPFDMKTGIVFFAGIVVAATVNAAQSWAFDWWSDSDTCRIYRSSNPGVDSAILCGEHNLRINEGYNVGIVRNSVFRTDIADNAVVGKRAIGVQSVMEAYGDTYRTEFVAFDGRCQIISERHCVGFRTNGSIQFDSGWSISSDENGIYAIAPGGRRGPVWERIVSEGFE